MRVAHRPWILDVREVGAPGLFSMALSFVAGFVDSVAFVALGFFPAHITGNFALIGDILTRSSGGYALKLLAFAAFVVGIAGAQVMAHRSERRSSQLRRPLLILEAALIAGFAVSGGFADSESFSGRVLAASAAILGAAAMGLQSATVNILLSEPTSTTAMTGNVTRLVLEISDLVLRGGDGAKRQRVARMVVLVLGFGLGAVAGPIGLVTFGFGVLLMPIITLAAVGASRRPWA